MLIRWTNANKRHLEVIHFKSQIIQITHADFCFTHGRIGGSSNEWVTEYLSQVRREERRRRSDFTRNGKVNSAREDPAGPSCVTTNHKLLPSFLSLGHIWNFSGALGPRTETSALVFTSEKLLYIVLIWMKGICNAKSVRGKNDLNICITIKMYFKYT